MDGFPATYTSEEVMAIGDQDHRRRPRQRRSARRPRRRARGRPARRLLRLLEAALAAQGRERRRIDHRQAQAGRGAAHQHRAGRRAGPSAPTASALRLDPAAAQHGRRLQRAQREHDLPRLPRPAPARTTTGWQRSWVDDNKTPDDPSDDVTYRGLTLKRLVARIDDGNPATFNKAARRRRLHRRGRGHGRLHRHLHERRGHGDRQQASSSPTAANGAPLAVPGADAR